MKLKLNNRSAVILLVEDNPADQRLTARALGNSKVEIDLRIANDGQEALDYLFRQSQFTDKSSSPFPDLIILDMNMPKINGKEFLKKIRNIPEFKIIPVIMFSTSEQKQDILDSYQLGVNSYITKPVDIKSFYEVFTRLEDFWLQTTVLPTAQ
jgi:CheY-like chemotaxis protein